MTGFDAAFWSGAAIAAAAGLGAGVIRGFSGFGSGLVLAPVLSVVFGPRIAVPAILLAHVVSGLQLLPGAARAVDWRNVAPMGIAGALSVPVGAYALVAIDQMAMRQMISIACVLFVLILLTGWRYQGGPRLWGKIAAGTTGGFFTGAAAIGGPPVILFQLAGPDSASVSRASFLLYFTFLQGATILSYWWGGLWSWFVVGLALVMVPSLMLGAWVGAHLFHRTSEKVFRRAALLFLLLVALATLLV